MRVIANKTYGFGWMLVHRDGVLVDRVLEVDTEEGWASIAGAEPEDAPHIMAGAFTISLMDDTPETVRREVGVLYGLGVPPTPGKPERPADADERVAAVIAERDRRNHAANNATQEA